MTPHMFFRMWIMARRELSPESHKRFLDVYEQALQDLDWCDAESLAARYTTTLTAFTRLYADSNPQKESNHER